MRHERREYGRRERINNAISSPTVRLIGPDGNMIGIKSTYEAIKLARQHGLELVEIASKVKPPVCKIMDYSKFKYEREKQKRENKKKQRSASFKEIKIHPRIAVHDLRTKINHAINFLEQRYKVRVSVVFHGRENEHKDLGYAILGKVKSNVGEKGKVEGKITQAGNTINIMLSPKQ